MTRARPFTPVSAPRLAWLALVLGLPLALPLPQAIAQEPCNPQRLIELVPSTQVDGTQTVSLTAPAAGRYVVTVIRAANAPKAKVELDGASLAGPKDFPQGKRTLRLELPLTPNVPATLRVSTVGRGALSFRVQGVVAEADLPAGTGQRVAPDRRCWRTLQKQR